MPIVEIASVPGERCLVILLPGVYSSAERFGSAGFGTIAAERGLAADIVAADAHLGYYRNRSVVERLREDVIAPAKRDGYDEIWIVGTSLGGLGGLLYLKEHPGEVSGVFAIAPFLGDEEVIAEIAQAGGPMSWQPPETVENDDVGRILWSWIVSDGIDSTNTPVHLGWGTKDDFDRSNRMLSGLLPPARVYTVDGGHDWDAWTTLWNAFLDRAKPCR